MKEQGGNGTWCMFYALRNRIDKRKTMPNSESARQMYLENYLEF